MSVARSAPPEMDATVSITTAEPPEPALARLEAFGREWRESKLPEDLRAAGYHTSTVSRRGDRIVITLGPTGHGPAYVLEGRFVASGSGSLFRGEVREARWSRGIVTAVLTFALLVLIGIVVRDDGRIGEDGALPIVIGIAIGGRALLVQHGKKAMAPLFIGLVEHALRSGEAATAGFERMYAIRDWYDGPLEGAADYQGVPHHFRLVYREGEHWDPDEQRFALTPLPPHVLPLMIEAWEAWRRYLAALRAGSAPKLPFGSPGVLPEDLERYEAVERQVEEALRSTRPTAIARGEFSTTEFEVQWRPVKE